MLFWCFHRTSGPQMNFWTTVPAWVIPMSSYFLTIWVKSSFFHRLGSPKDPNKSASHSNITFGTPFASDPTDFFWLKSWLCSANFLLHSGLYGIGESFWSSQLLASNFSRWCLSTLAVSGHSFWRFSHAPTSTYFEFLVARYATITRQWAKKSLMLLIYLADRISCALFNCIFSYCIHVVLDQFKQPEVHVDDWNKKPQARRTTVVFSEFSRLTMLSCWSKCKTLTHPLSFLQRKFCHSEVFFKVGYWNHSNLWSTVFSKLS